MSTATPVPAESTTPTAKVCDTCGGAVAFDPASQGLRCRQCGATTPIEAGTSGTTEHQPFTAELRADDADHRSGAPVRLECSGCGAPADHVVTTIATTCGFCKASFVTAPLDGSLAPQAVLPLHVTQDAASSTITEWLGHRWFAPRALAKGAALGKLQPTYSPSWVFDMTVTAEYEGRRGDNYMVPVSHTSTDANGNTTTSTTMETRIRWHHAEGTVRDHFTDLLVAAGNDGVAREISDIKPWGIDDAMPYADDIVRGTEARGYELGAGAGELRATNATDEAIEGLIKDDIGGDHQDINHIRRTLSDVTYLYLLLPAWIVAYTFHGKPYEVVVNGRTGAIAGTRPTSWAKVVLAVVAALLLIAAIVLYLINRSHR